MPPTAAETARTLAAGHLPGRLTLSTLPGDIPVSHVTTEAGQVLIAARRGSRAWQALDAGRDDETAVLTAWDVPPFPESPWLGRVHVCGWFHRVGDTDLLDDPDLFGAASALAAASAPERLPGTDLFRIELGEAWLEQPDPVPLEPEEFAAAAADLLYPHERDLLLDLREHHAAELAALAAADAGQCLPVRLDQYGLVLAMPELHRLEFRYPADCPRCVGHVLRLRHTGHR